MGILSRNKSALTTGLENFPRRKMAMWGNIIGMYALLRSWKRFLAILINASCIIIFNDGHLVQPRQVQIINHNYRLGQLGLYQAVKFQKKSLP